MMARIPKIYFSFRSPYSWLALDTLSDLGLREALDYVPLWEPREPIAGALTAAGARLLYHNMSRAKHLYILQDVKRLAASRSKNLVWPIDQDPAWDLPHLAWLACKRLGTHWDFYDRIIDLRWMQGVDVCIEENIREVLDACGLGSVTFEDLCADKDVIADGVTALRDCYENDVFGMPYFKVGFHRFWGIDRLGMFLSHIEVDNDLPHSVADIPHAVTVSIGSYDTDTAGGCG